MELIKVKCTKSDIDALKVLYYYILVELQKKKGLSYKNAFRFQKRLNDLKKELNKYNLDEIMEVL